MEALLYVETVEHVALGNLLIEDLCSGMKQKKKTFQGTVSILFD